MIYRPKNFSGLIWDSYRFGVHPSKWKARFIGNGPKILCNSLPKAGTHLLERALCLVDSIYRPMIPTVYWSNNKYRDPYKLIKELKPGQVIVSHLSFQKELARQLVANDVKSLLMVRDPRDMVISRVNYMKKQINHPDRKYFQKLNTRNQIKLAIEGDSKIGFKPISRFLEYLDWVNESHVVRFEKLIGPEGSGDGETQFAELSSLFSFLELKLNSEQIEKIQLKLFSKKSSTFNKGTSGNWNKYFDEELRDLFKTHGNDLLIKLGYESNTDW